MPIIQATTTHAAQVRHLLHNGRHVYGSFGDEDLASLLTKGLALLGEDQATPWGFLSIQVEERPITLPPTAPDRAYLRAVALDQGRSPSQDVPLLMQLALRQLNNSPRRCQLIVYGGEAWLTRPLFPLGFSLTERVQFFRLDLTRRVADALVTPEVAQLRPLHPPDLPALAELDAAAFEPLWHFGEKELWELLFRSRMQVALWEGKLVGYSAITANGDEAHLARLAVHPAVQGMGIGRQLLIDSIAYAHDQQFTAVALNTQVSNTRSQRLYRQLGFRPTGLVLPVLTKIIP